MAQRYVYVLNSGVSSTTSALPSNAYVDRKDAFPTTAFSSVGVNPTIKATGVSDEYDGKSANFFEIRKAEHDGHISSNADDKIVNRIHPINKTITDYATNKEKTSSYKIRCFDSSGISTDIHNKRLKYSNDGLNGTNWIHVDLDKYDYFVLINPDIYFTDSSGDTITTIRPHFAKIKQLVSYDEYGDGFEFTPKYSGAVPFNSKFEIFRGPNKTSSGYSDIVAVSYGLRGDTAYSSSGDYFLTEKYDVSSNVSKPTWYFYNDGLDNNDQLNNNTKYVLTTCRWWPEDFTTSFSGSVNSGSGSYQIEANSKISYTGTDPTLVMGQTLYRYDGSSRYRIGNVVSIDLDNNVVMLDVLRTTWSSSQTIEVGRTVHQTVFKTETEQSPIVTDLGRLNHDALLVDNSLTNDKTINVYGVVYEDVSGGTGYTFNPSRWKDAFRNILRQANDYNSAHTSFPSTGSSAFLHGGFTGPTKYLYFKSSKLKNNNVSMVIDTVLNNPKNKMSQMAKIKTLDHMGIQHLKLKEDSSFIIRNSIFTGNFNEYKLPFTVTSSSTTALGVTTYKITLNAITEVANYSDANVIKANDIIRIGQYYYRVSLISTPSNNKQIITVTHKRNHSEKFFYSMSSIENFIASDIYVQPINRSQSISGAFPIDTEVVHGESNRLTINGNTINKTDSGIYNDKLVLAETDFFSIDIPIEYGDSIHQYIKLQEPLKEFYIPNTPISFLHYFKGKFMIDEEIFSGTVEEINSDNENGMLTFNVVGRDKVSKLLSNTINKNLNHSDDIVYSTLNPIANSTTSLDVITVSGSNGSGQKVLSIAGIITAVKYDLIFDSNGILLGEVDTINSTSNTNITLLDNLSRTVASTETIELLQISDAPYITGTKALGANILMSNYPTDFSSAGEKGVVFNDGIKIAYSGTNQTFTDLPYTSATGEYLLDKSLGYDITGVKGIVSGVDSDFAFKLALEQEANIDYKTVHTPSAQNYFSIVDMSKQEGNKTIFTVAPTFPVVLGSIEQNTSDIRLNNSYLYLVNRNIPNGGFIHSLTDSHGSYYNPNQTFRYTDLQQFKGGTIKETHNSIYDGSLIPQRILGASPAYKINMFGTTQTLSDTTGGLLPIEGSNLLDSRYTKADTIFPDGYPIQYYDTTAKDFTSDLENIDCRTKTYELLALGDIYPESNLRHNNLGFADSEFSSFGMLLESASQQGGNLSHENYTGQTNENLITDSNFERIEIEKGSINTNAMRRWGIVRLVESTFDWHFNPVNIESTKETLPLVDNIKYPRVKVPTTTATLNVTNDGDTWTFSVNITLATGDLIYSQASGQLLARIVTGTTGTIWYATSSTPSLTSLNLEDEDFSGVVFIITNEIELFDTYSDDGWGINTLSTTNKIRMDRVYVALGNVEKSYLGYMSLRDNSVNFNAHNIFIPLLSTVSTDGAGSNNLNHTYSAYHDSENDWPDATQELYYHYSRVLSGLCSDTFDSFDATTQYYLRNYQIINGVKTDDHIYDNCMGIFKNFMGSVGEATSRIAQVSSPLKLDTTYNSFKGTSATTLDQHSPNLMINTLSTNKIAIVGTRTKNELFQTKTGKIIDGDSFGNRTNYHNKTVVASDNGELYQAQMFVKPKFNLSGKSGTLLTFTLDGTTGHNWLSFMPNLTGQYLVSDKLLDGNYLPTEQSSATMVAEGTPKFITKITNHEVDWTTNTTYVTHKITVDTSINPTTYGNYYRLMRISETTFEDTPDSFEVNKMFDSGLQYDTFPENFKKGVRATSDLQYQEGVYAMYLMLDIDNQNTHIERRSIADIDNFTTGNKTVYVTDGENSQLKLMRLTKLSSETNPQLKFTYDGTLTGFGVVSFGETFTLESLSTPKLNNPKRAYIGTTFSVGTDAERAIENILEENDIDVDKTDRNLTYTTNIIAAKPTTTALTLVNSYTNLSEDDIIYTQEGRLIGKIFSLSTTTVTVDELFNIPNAYDEIVTYNKKPFILNTKFNEQDVFSSINFLATKRSLDYTFEGDKIKITNADDYQTKRKFSLRYSDGKNLIAVNSNKSLFDKANKIIVIGDNIKAEAEIPTKKSKRVIKHIDPNIKNIREAQIKALQLLELHNDPARQITLTMHKEGFELMKAGDLITLNFPNHNIPQDDYIVFEIENVLSSITKITVGTFSKTIAERLAELSLSQSVFNTKLFTKETTKTVSNQVIFEESSLREVSLKYQVTTPAGSLLGFTTILGFDSILDTGTDSVTTGEIDL